MEEVLLLLLLHDEAKSEALAWLCFRQSAVGMSTLWDPNCQITSNVPLLRKSLPMVID